ncbi:hypothetical protein COL922a_014248, partial [Colletotrichum nupharicola]
MAESLTPNYPTSLSTLFDETSLNGQYDPVQLEDGGVKDLLGLPLAKEIFGNNTADEGSLDRVSRGEISYTQFVAEKTQAVASAPVDGLNPEQQKSQLLYI